MRSPEVNVREYWRDHEESTIGLFVVVNEEAPRLVKRTVTSLQKLTYTNAKIYLIDISQDARHPALALELGCTYIHTLPVVADIHEAAHRADDLNAIVIVAPGITLKKAMLRELMPYLSDSTAAVTASLAITPNKTVKSAKYGRIGIQRRLLLADRTNGSIQVVPLTLAQVNHQHYSPEVAAIVEQGLQVPKSSWRQRWAAWWQMIAVHRISLGRRKLISASLLLALIVAPGAMIVRAYANAYYALTPISSVATLATPDQHRPAVLAARIVQSSTPTPAPEISKPSLRVATVASSSSLPASTSAPSLTPPTQAPFNPQPAPVPAPAPVSNSTPPPTPTPAPINPPAKPPTLTTTLQTTINNLTGLLGGLL